MKKIIFMALSVFLIGADKPSNKSSEPIWIGILRVDGVLIPFAQNDGTKWIKPWPEADQGLDVSIPSIAKIPKSWLGLFKRFPDSWNFISLKNEKSILKIKNAFKFETHCSAGWGFQTDYPNAQETEGAPIPKMGLAINKGDFQVPVRVDLKTTTEKDVSTFLKHEFEEVEDARIKRLKSDGTEGGFLSDSSIPIERAKRRGAKFRDFDIFRVSENVYYFNLWRAYPRTENEEYPNGSEMNGWIVRNPNKGYTILEKHIYVFPVDEKGDGDYGFSGSRVLGAVKVNGEYFYIVENYFYEAESYSVLEIDNNKIKKVIESEGGGC